MAARRAASTIDLWREELTESGGEITAAVTLEGSGGQRQCLWYRLPAEYRAALTRSCDPFVIGALFRAMRSSSDLVVHGEVSPSLLRSVDEFQAAWSSWKPGTYTKIGITADREGEQQIAATSAAVMGFSGGADSSFTAWRHRRGLAGRAHFDLRAGVMVHGFDIPLKQVGAYGRAAENAGRMLSSIGMKLIPMTTNFRDLSDNWHDAFGAGLISCLMLLHGQFRFGIVAGGAPYADIFFPCEEKPPRGETVYSDTFPCGSNPLTDLMLSSDTFRVVHDGAASNRLEKSRELAHWPEAMKYLRVCWEGEQKDRNCCRCQKCVSNMLYFRIVNRGTPECFERDLSDAELVWMRFPEEPLIESMKRLIRAARKESISDSWVRALTTSVLINRLRLKARRLLG